MARSIATLLLAALLPVAAWSAPPSVGTSKHSSSTERTVEARSRAWVKAALDGDVDAFQSFATDDYVMLWVDPASNGQPARWHARSRDEWVDMLRTGKVKYSSVVFRNTKVRVNGDIAIFTGEYSQKAVGDGTESDESGFFVETWVKRHGLWLAVSTVFP
jgi:ketosteroid isomerase-like protein